MFIRFEARRYRYGSSYISFNFLEMDIVCSDEPYFWTATGLEPTTT